MKLFPSWRCITKACVSHGRLWWRSTRSTQRHRVLLSPVLRVLMRCGGCCSDDALECLPTETRNVTLELIRSRPHVTQHPYQLSFTEHTKCKCLPKQEVKVKKEKKPREGRGKGQKRKRKREREASVRLEFYTSTARFRHTGSLSLLVFGLVAAELLCSV
ncbi:hypothetical protein ACEWY4_020364 [Coilia grayii]|uniref:Platelet-derived growth factor (PDGF) family profile domain-containing protein n=1 Tax=Coilia grayii TaxID=363190 RepID=A0ABD1JFJ9_9TELE